MNSKIIQLLKNTAARLIFALASGGAYYIIVLKFILTHTGNGGGLLGFFFFPAIVGGAALVLIKTLRSHEEKGDTAPMLRLFWAHLILIIISIAFLLSMIK